MKLFSNFLPQLKSYLNKYRLILIAFAAIYAAFLLINLPDMAIHWDEINHFNGGLMLIRGQLYQYIMTNSFYPPIFNFFTAGFFAVGGPSVLTGRLVAVTFSLLTLFVVYELAQKMYGPKTALLSSVLLGVMPGIFWLSRIALIETALIFVFSLSMLFFFKWLNTNHERDRILSIAAFAIGVAVKYQTLVLAPIIVIACLLVFQKGNYLKAELARYLKFPRLIFTIAAAAAAVIIIYVLFVSGLINPWLYAIQVGTADKAAYSVRFPAPIFYLIEMTWPKSSVHPISLLLYIAGIAGLALFAWRRKPQDKFLLVWFAAVYIVFTAIPNREWRYVTPLFPVMAISAASIITFALGKTQKIWQTTKNSLTKKRVAKFAAAVLIALTVVGIFYSCADAYYWVESDQFQVPVQEATVFASLTLSPNQSIAVACPLNFINDDMVWFYLNQNAPSQSSVWQYPKQAVDAYTPNFNKTEFVNLCQQNNTKYVLLYENGKNPQYYESTVTPSDITNMLNATGRFTIQSSFGTAPYRIFVFSFT
jgi:4-amino-4-deoxy-L-arabinose transferase-like glycosyltransferase